MSTSPSSFPGLESARPDRSRTMFPDLTRDDVFRLETRRLWLRWPRLADAQAIVRLAGEKAANFQLRVDAFLQLSDHL